MANYFARRSTSCQGVPSRKVHVHISLALTVVPGALKAVRASRDRPRKPTPDSRTQSAPWVYDGRRSADISWASAPRRV